MALQDVLNKAAESLGEFHAAHDTTVAAQQALDNDKQVELDKAAAAQSDVSDAIKALTDELAGLPPSTPAAPATPPA